VQIKPVIVNGMETNFAVRFATDAQCHRVEADAAGSCAVPRGPINQDWVLVLK
jgi:hypothetical protein